MNKSYSFAKTKWFAFLGSGELPIHNLAPKVLFMSISIIGLTLFTNQYFHGGVFGKLHNKSVKPKVEISAIRYDNSKLTFQLYRVEGADVYGSFLIGIQILDEKNQIIKFIGQEELAQFPKEQIRNHYVAKIKPGKHSLILPLGAKADISINLEGIKLKGRYTLKLIDISGIEWTAEIR